MLIYARQQLKPWSTFPPDINHVIVNAYVAVDDQVSKDYTDFNNSVAIVILILNLESANSVIYGVL